MWLLGQFQVSLFFLRKNFNHKNAPKRKTNNFHPLRSFCARENLLPLFTCFCLVHWFWFDLRFCAHKVFS